MLRNCDRCGKSVNHSKADTAFRHKNPVSGEWCVAAPDEFETPETSPLPSIKGPWFGAMYDGRCSVNECEIYEGDRIRSDGEGGYECEDCEDFDDAMDRHVRVSLGIDSADPVAVTYQEQASAAAKRHLAAQVGDTPFVALLKDELQDEFDTPATVPVKLNVSGQPEARRDHAKRYIVVDPDLGDFRRTVCKEKKPKGITRATTFNKAAQNTTSLNAWGKRNVVMGASLRPDILRRAHGLTHDNGKDELNRVVDELEKAAGAKVAADEGSFLHEFTDQIDAGLKTWRDAPPAYQADLKRYVEALAKEGLEPVPGLIERTTFIREYGGVAGTFDRIFYHVQSGQYVPGDLKTGKTMSYAMDETECQIWIYAHGVNQNGIYDWNTDTWGPALAGMLETDPEERQQITVSETVGVIVHMPVQGPEAGEVHLRFANLERGRAYADLNHAVRSYQKSKVLPFEMPGIEAGPGPTWEERFAAVTTVAEAGELWEEARSERVPPMELQRLVQIAQQVLAGKG